MSGTRPAVITLAVNIGEIENEIKESIGSRLSQPQRHELRINPVGNHNSDTAEKNYEVTGSVDADV